VDAMSDDQPIVEQLTKLLAPFAKEGQSIDENTRLVLDLSLDSMQVMELLSQVEDKFDISVPLNILPDVLTVKDLAEQIQKLLGSR
jgi:acyl carrier protein